MKFKHWKEALKRAQELEPLIKALNADIDGKGAEARNEELGVEKRESLIKEIEGKITERDGLTAEHAEAMKAEQELRSAEERQISMLSNLSTEKIAERQKRSGDEGKEVLATRAYELAWAQYIRTGNDAEVRSLITTQGTTKIMVPTTLINRIEDKLKTGGRILALCSVERIQGITEYPIAGERSDPDSHNETGGQEKKEKEITLTSVSMEPQFVAEIIKTTRKFEADSISAFWEWLLAELPDAIKRVIDRKILMGGQGEKDGIHGILTNEESAFVATLENHELNFNTGNTAVSYLDDGMEDNATIIMNRKTFFGNVMGMEGTDGHPIWQQMTSNTGRPAFAMNGFPVVFSNILPEYDKATEGQPYMVMGDFRAMKMNFPLGMEPNLIRDEITEMKNNIINYLSEIYAAGNITRLGAFVKVTK